MKIGARVNLIKNWTKYKDHQKVCDKISKIKLKFYYFDNAFKKNSAYSKKTWRLINDF